MKKAGVITQQDDPLKSEGLLIAWPRQDTKTAAGPRQVVIKNAVIPTMNSSWAGSQGEKAKDGQIGRGETTEAGGER